MHYLPTKWPWTIIAAMVALGGAGAAPAIATAQSGQAGHVYVNDDTKGTNTVAGFVRRADGSLAALPGSPFSAGGEGTGGGLASQGAIASGR